MTETAVVNASPLIFLSRGGHLSLLKRFYTKVLVPEQVSSEIHARGPDDATVMALSTAEWIEVANTEHIPAEIGAWGLGHGESAVVALAVAMPETEAIIDDLAGRRCASSLGVPVRGTLGLILRAKQQDIIPAARPVLEDLIRGGMYLSRHVLERALERVAE